MDTDKYKQKFYKYATKNKQIIKTMFGGGYTDEEWFTLRKAPLHIPPRAAITYDFFLETKGDKFGEGGQSEIFKYKPNPFVLMRMIPRQIGESPNPNYEMELEINKQLTEVVLSNINPHFVISYTVAQHPENSAYQLIELLDGDITNAHFTVAKLRADHMFEQLLFGLYTLATLGFVLRDVKRQNILYKNLDKKVGLVYIFKEKYYMIVTKTVYLYADFGKASPIKTDCGGGSLEDKFLQCAKNISDLNSLAVLSSGAETVEALSYNDINTFLKTSDDKICGLEIPTDISLITKMAGTKIDKYIKCIFEKILSLKESDTFKVFDDAPVQETFEFPLVGPFFVSGH